MPAKLDGKRILITGASGFTGWHLITWLRANAEAELFGIGRSTAPKKRLDGCLVVDLCDAAAVARAVTLIQPDVVFHLAAVNGRAPVGDAWKVNVQSSANLFTALDRHAAAYSEPIRIVAIGSAAEIGARGAADSPVPESVHCEPESEYGKSKQAVTQMALGKHEGPLEVVVARTFNLLGPHLSRDLALGNICAQVLEIRNGQRETVRCGSLAAKRDFVDVRDAVRAYSLLAAKGKPGQLYNVCSGTSHSLRSLVSKTLYAAEVNAEIVEESQCRAGDVPDIFGDRTKIEQGVGWVPKISIEQSIVDMVRQEVRA